MIKVYFAYINAFDDNALYEKAFSRLSVYRQKKVRSFKLEKDRRLSLCAGMLLDAGLYEYGLHEKDMLYAEGENGKPYFVSRPDIHFSISHSKDIAVCVFSDFEVGCDIQYKTKANLSVAKRFFCAGEYAAIIEQKSEEDKKNMFFDLWTLKESLLKLTGDGITKSLSSVEFFTEQSNIVVKQNGQITGFCFIQPEINDSYSFAACQKGKIKDFCIKQIDISDYFAIKGEL